MAEHCKFSVDTLGDGVEESHGIIRRMCQVIKVDGYSRCKKLLKNGECVTSEPFSLDFYPNGSNDTQSIALYLYDDPCDDHDVDVNVKFSLLDKDGVPVPLGNGTYFWQISSTSRFMGFCDFIEEGSVHIVDDSFSIRCDLTLPEDIGSKETKGDEFPVVPADVTIHVGGEKFLAHKSVPAARSTVFKAELFGAMKEKSSDPIGIDDMEADVFKSLLSFIYTDSVPVLDMDCNKGDVAAIAGHLLVAADRYNIKALKLTCEERLCNHIDSNTVATLALAEQHGCKGLKEACFEFLASPSNLKVMKASDGYEHLKKSCPSVLKELITRLLPAEFETVKDIIMEI